MLFGAMQCIAVTIGSAGALRAVRCEIRRKTAQITAAEVLLPSNEPLQERLIQLGKKIGLKKENTLVIAPADCGGVFFRTRFPEMPARELRSALQFEGPQHLLLAGNESPKQIFWAMPQENGLMTVWAWIVPENGLKKLLQSLQDAHWLPDAILSPYLAAAPLGGEKIGAVSLPEFDPGFFWQDGNFHPDRPGTEYNKKLKALLKQEFQLADTLPDSVWDEFLPCIMLCCCMRRQEHLSAGIRDFNIVPPALRPQRLRSQLRITVLLLAGCLLLYGGKFIKSSIEYCSQYHKLSNSVRLVKQRTANMQRKLRAKEKDLKEMNRILDANETGGDLLLQLAALSEALPENVLASSVRLNETGMDLILHTNQENVDLAASLQKFPAYRIGTLQNRKQSDTLNQITLRLKRSQEKK